MSKVLELVRAGSGYLFYLRFARDKRGATAVEFTLIAMPFLGLLMATFDMGMGFLVERNLDAAVQNAARQIRTGAMQGAGVTTSQTFVNTFLCPASGNLIGSFIDCTKLIVDVRSATSFAGNDMSNDFYKTESTNRFCLGAPKTITVVRVAYPMPWFVPVLVGVGAANNAGLVNDVPGSPGWKLLLVSASAVRTEPYPGANYLAYQSDKGC